MIFRNNIQEIRRGDKRIDSGEYNEGVRKLNALGNFTFNAEDYQSMRWTGSQWILIARRRIEQVFTAGTSAVAQVITGTDNIDWNNEGLAVKGSDFDHSVSTNPDEITFNAIGTYFVRVNIALQVTATGVPPFNVLESVIVQLVTDGDVVLAGGLACELDLSQYGENDQGGSIHHGSLLAYIDSGADLDQTNRTLRVRCFFSKILSDINIRRGTFIQIQKTSATDTT